MTSLSLWVTKILGFCAVPPNPLRVGCPKIPRYLSPLLLSLLRGAPGQMTRCRRSPGSDRFAPSGPLRCSPIRHYHCDTFTQLFDLFLRGIEVTQVKVNARAQGWDLHTKKVPQKVFGLSLSPPFQGTFQVFLLFFLFLFLFLSLPVSCSFPPLTREESFRKSRNYDKSA